LTALKDGADQVTATYRYIRKDGSLLWVESNMQIVPGTDADERQFVANMRDITQRKAAEDAVVVLNAVLAAQARTDSLMGIANRRRFDEALEHEWARALRTGSTLSLLMIDVDRFKLYNDRYGHQQGDLCLKAIADAVAQAARRPGDLVARYGGEEIGVLLPETDADGASEIAERVRASIEASAIEHRDSVPWGIVTASLGAATLKPIATDEPAAASLVELADRALYQAKRAGRNQVVAFASTPRTSGTLLPDPGPRHKVSRA